MLRRILICSGMLLTSYASAARLHSQNTSTSASAVTNRAVLDKYCVTCHNQNSATAGLMLDKMDLQKVGENAAVWEKVVRKLRTRAMPPPGRPRPDAAGYDLLITRLESQLDLAAAAKLNPGAAGIGANAIIRFLVDKGADLNPKDRDGYTPLAVAAGRAPRGGDSASRVYEDTMGLLVKLGAQPLVSPR